MACRKGMRRMMFQLSVCYCMPTVGAKGMSLKAQWFGGDHLGFRVRVPGWGLQGLPCRDGQL